MPITDLLTGYLAFGAINAALYAGKGQHLSVSLYDSSLSALMTHVSSMYLYGNTKTKWTGNQHPSLVPNGVYDTKDGQIVLGVYAENEWPILCDVLGGDIKDKLYHDPKGRFKNNLGRVVNRKQFNEVFEAELKSQTSKYWIDKIESSDIGRNKLIYSKVQKVSEALDNNKSVKTRLNQMLIDLPYNAIDGRCNDKVKAVGFPIKMSGTNPNIRYGVPRFGQHSVEILKQYLGFDDDMIKAYEKEGVIKAFNVVKSKL